RVARKNSGGEAPRRGTRSSIGPRHLSRHLRVRRERLAVSHRGLITHLVLGNRRDRGSVQLECDRILIDSRGAIHNDYLDLLSEAHTLSDPTTDVLGSDRFDISCGWR